MSCVVAVVPLHRQLRDCCLNEFGRSLNDIPR